MLKAAGGGRLSFYFLFCSEREPEKMLHARERLPRIRGARRAAGATGSWPRDPPGNRWLRTAGCGEPAQPAGRAPKPVPSPAACCCAGKGAAGELHPGLAGQPRRERTSCAGSLPRVAPSAQFVAETLNFSFSRVSLSVKRELKRLVRLSE